MAEALRWSQTAIDLADGDPTKGNFIIGSPLAVTGALRGIARFALGRPGWRDDLDWALAMAREADPLSHVIATGYTYFSAIPNGVLPADDFVLRETEEALRITERSSDDFAVGNARLALGVVLVHRDSPAERERGLEGLEQVRGMCLKGRIYRSLLAAVDGFTARERPGAETATPRSQNCVEPSTTCSLRDSSGSALRPQGRWWRRCCTGAPRVTCGKPRPRSTGWRPRQSTKGS